MSWRFRKSLRLGGLRFNIGKSGFNSVSVGGRGITANISDKGVRHTFSIPRTGLSFQTKRSGHVSSDLPSRSQGSRLGGLWFMVLWLVVSIAGASVSAVVGGVVSLALLLVFLFVQMRRSALRDAEIREKKVAMQSEKANQDRAVAALLAFWSAMTDATTLEQVDAAASAFQAIAAEVDLVGRERDEQVDLADRVRAVIRVRAEWSSGAVLAERGTIHGVSYFWKVQDVERRDEERGTLYLTAEGLRFDTADKSVVRKWRDVANIALADSAGRRGFVSVALRNRVNKDSFKFSCNQEARLVVDLASQLAGR
jgi:hypothetical protein